MAQWEELLRLDGALQGRVKRLYEGKLHRDVRSTLSPWIESQDWDSAAADESRSRLIFNSLLVEVEQLRRSTREDTTLQGPDFSWMKHHLLGNFGDDPQKLAVLLSECLKEEKKILASQNKAQDAVDPAMEQNRRKMAGWLKHLMAALRKETNTLEDLNEKLDILQKTWQDEVKQHVGPSHAERQQEFMRTMAAITQTKQLLLKQAAAILKEAEQTLTWLVGEELPRWKRRQQLACIGSPQNTDLHHLQTWFTSVGEVLFGVFDQLQKTREQSRRFGGGVEEVDAAVEEIDAFAASLLTRLLRNALVVEKQPATQNPTHRRLILKTKVLFQVALRFLVSHPRLERRLCVTPVFDKDVEEVKTLHGFRHIELTSNDSEALDVDPVGGGLTAVFLNMSVVEKKSRIKGSSENHLGVTEELHVIKFVTTVQLPELKGDVEVEVSSLPVVVISSTSQAPSAWASIMWWNLLSSGQPWNLSLFTNPPPLSWELLSQALSWQFLTVGRRGLDEQQLVMLRDKLVNHPEDLVQWSSFSKNENAWIWIDGILNLIKKHLLDLWRDGSIMGFVSKERTRSLLWDKPVGTFLLRFSESNKDGAITFSWLHQSGGEKRVLAVDPYTKHELATLSLPDVINHYSLRAEWSTRNPLLYLYPDIPRDEAFQRYYKAMAMPSTASGYIHRKAVFTSDDPSPPPSPPEALYAADTETDMETGTDWDQLAAELFPTLQECSGPSQPWTFHQDTDTPPPLPPLWGSAGAF